MNKAVWLSAGRGAILPFATLMLVGLMVVPVPAALLDVGFIANIMISLAVLMVGAERRQAARLLLLPDRPAVPTPAAPGAERRLDPRSVLVSGHEGSDAAGHVIEAFGNS
jgi:flagellar biosynthesis protein FlhA